MSCVCTTVGKKTTETSCTMIDLQTCSSHILIRSKIVSSCPIRIFSSVWVTWSQTLVCRFDIYVCMRSCMCVWIYIYTYVQAYIYIYIYIYISVSTYTSTHIIALLLAKECEICCYNLLHMCFVQCFSHDKVWNASLSVRSACSAPQFESHGLGPWCACFI